MIDDRPFAPAKRPTQRGARPLPRRRIASGQQKGEGMPCPQCGTYDHRVMDSRAVPNGQRRRHLCVNEHRFNSFETTAVASHWEREFMARARRMTNEQRYIVLALIGELVKDDA